MTPKQKSTIVGVLLVVLTAFGAGVGIATLLVMPVGVVGSTLTATGLILASVVTWMWACYARKEIFE